MEPLKIEMHTFVPYLFAAIWQWLVDAGDSPFIHVDTNVAGVMVPKGYADEKTGIVILNTSPNATNNLTLEDGAGRIAFDCRFNSKQHRVIVPYNAVRAIVGRLSGFTNQFPVPPEPVVAASAQAYDLPTEPTEPKTPAKRGHLSVVK
jgi:stringent starvation protein B